jgi:hypothetical protein
LAGADLAGAYLAGAYLAGADLAGAYLAGADLAGAYLAGAYLARADLAGAHNVPAALADPVEPYVRKPERSRVERMRVYRERHPDVPVVSDLDRKVLASVQDGARLEMGAWHTCESTHCRGGWAIHHAGVAGYDLEEKLGNPLLAARAIYMASTGRSPFFFDSNEGALADIKRCAAESEETP